MIGVIHADYPYCAISYGNPVLHYFYVFLDVLKQPGCHLRLQHHLFCQQDHSIKLVMPALPNLRANLDALEPLREISFSGRTAAIARFPDEVKILQQSGATAVFNIYTEAGAGFANHVKVQNRV